MELSIKKENLSIQYEKRDTKQPYRVINKPQKQTQNRKDRWQIICFCQSEQEAKYVINNLDSFFKEKY